MFAYKQLQMKCFEIKYLTVVNDLNLHYELQNPARKTILLQRFMMEKVFKNYRIKKAKRFRLLKGHILQFIGMHRF